MRVLALLDGTLADPESPVVRVDDLGLLRGDGVFETVLVVDGRPRELAAHLDRLVASAAMLELPAPDRAAFDRAVGAVLDAWAGGRELVMRLVHTRGVEGGDGTPTGFVLGSEINPATLRHRADGIAAVTLERGFDEGLARRAPWLLLGAKSLSYAVNMAALREAERRGAADVLFTTSDGLVLEGPTSTVIAASDGILRTTPTALGILPGTTQAALFRAAERAGWVTKVESLRVADLRAADGVFLASSIRRITRVHTLDGEPLTDSAALHAELTALYESEY
ncbi:aminodeoxychorismate lyase [Solihabitans fulvus]|uniref:Aminodeoxychorismate lyase n=1 Tax=Solihabitans fulvus TaxID=1892852 RepID=A0A5B2XAA1_9PSEU|nr:aminodeoxychorismate lyase [Solihabitans fulvus]KAA2260163.1 aminodeoxychorismate lyase [Solihabitans fulvus]